MLIRREDNQAFGIFDLRELAGEKSEMSVYISPRLYREEKTDRAGLDMMLLCGYKDTVKFGVLLGFILGGALFFLYRVYCDCENCSIVFSIILCYAIYDSQA